MAGWAAITLWSELIVGRSTSRALGPTANRRPGRRIRNAGVVVGRPHADRVQFVRYFPELISSNSALRSARRRHGWLKNSGRPTGCSSVST
jgi:hypothetical protein